ncbi:MAG TPA: GTPase HflX [Acidimicrobiia bacterium]
MTADESRGRQRRRLTATVTDLAVPRQRAYLVGVSQDGRLDDSERSLVELGLLADTAGSEAVGREVVRVRGSFDPATLIGKGKAEQLADEARVLDVDVVVFDVDLTAAQERNLQAVFGCDVVDRVALILDIFAQHASSHEGRIQVELALLHYHLPRLRGRGTEMSRLGGGIGTRGPGETKLETDRRRILHRIAHLERDLRKLRRVRDTQRKARVRSDLPVVALVGYTNAGKSTLLNHLTGAGVLVEDRLFSTLDPTVRRYRMANGTTLLISDTVGFVRRLPHELVEAFQSTLVEVVQADLLLHVVDASDPDAFGQITAVRAVLEEIGAASVPELTVLNKTDIAERAGLNRLRELLPDAVVVSALKGDNIADLEAAIEGALAARTVELKLEIPFDRGDALASLHGVGELIREEHTETGTLVVARVPLSRAHQFDAFAL